MIHDVRGRFKPFEYLARLWLDPKNIPRDARTRDLGSRTTHTPCYSMTSLENRNNLRMALALLQLFDLD
jgi:hypothetical protein